MNRDSPRSQPTPALLHLLCRVDLDVKTGIFCVALGQEEAVVGFSYLQFLQVSRAVEAIDATTGTAIARFDYDGIVGLRNLLEETWMSYEVGRRDG